MKVHADSARRRFTQRPGLHRAHRGPVQRAQPLHRILGHLQWLQGHDRGPCLRHRVRHRRGPRARPMAASSGQAGAGMWVCKELQQLSPIWMAADMPMSWLANKAAAQPYTTAARESWNPDEASALRSRQPVKRPTIPGGGSSGTRALSTSATPADNGTGPTGAASSTQALTSIGRPSTKVP